MAAAEGMGWELLRDARQGRLQRSLSLVAGLTSGLSGLEVAYMHYRGSYSNRVMWTPIVLSQALLAAGIAGAARPRLARTLLPTVTAITLADCGTGFVFHLRGIGRKPGGFRLLATNVVMGPPPMAPLLFGMSAYMGLVAARMSPEGSGQSLAGRDHLRKHVAVITGMAALFSGLEALYSHSKNNFRNWLQYTPLVVAPTLAAAAFHAAVRPARGRKLLAAASALGMANGAVGAAMHVRGVARRPGGRRHLFYNLMYGPPVLAPLLFAGCGFLGLLASAIQGARQ